MAPINSTPIKNLLASKRIIVVLGSGGVGKTTSSIALALKAATSGKTVGLMSIDPAKRLAEAMGLELGQKLRKVELPREITGELHACMLDQAAVFDSMVRRYTSRELASQIFENRVYQQVSRNLGGPLEYMAMAKLNDLIEQERFDLIVVDTPPDTHALDFLIRPNILAGFMEKGVMMWLIKPFIMARKMGLGRLMNFGEKMMGGIASVTGVRMLETLSEFLVLMEKVLEGFHTSGRNVATTLRSDDTGFVILSSPLSASTRSAMNLSQKLWDLGFPLHGVIVNRVTPMWVEQGLMDYCEGQHSLDLEGFTESLDGLTRKTKVAQENIGKYKNHLESLWRQKIPIVEVEEKDRVIHSLDGILNFAQELS